MNTFLLQDSSQQTSSAGGISKRLQATKILLKAKKTLHFLCSYYAHMPQEQPKLAKQLLRKEEDITQHYNLNS